MCVYMYICICGYLGVFWNVFVWEIDGKIDVFESISLQKLGYHVVEYDGKQLQLAAASKAELIMLIFVTPGWQDCEEEEEDNADGHLFQAAEIQ